MEKLNVCIIYHINTTPPFGFCSIIIYNLLLFLFSVKWLNSNVSFLDQDITEGSFIHLCPVSYLTSSKVCLFVFFYKT